MTTTNAAADLEVCDLTARLARVERQARLLKRALVAVVVPLGVVLLAGAWAQDRPGRVEVRELILRDADGKARGLLGMTDDGPQFSLFGADAKPQLVMALNRFGSGVTLNDAEGRPRMGMAVLPNGSTELTLTDSAGRPRAQLLVQDDVPRLNLLDPQGNARAVVLAADEFAGLAFFDDGGNRRVLLASDVRGPAISLTDRQGKLRAGMSVFNDSGADLRLLDEQEEILFSKPDR